MTDDYFTKKDRSDYKAQVDEMLAKSQESMELSKEKFMELLKSRQGKPMLTDAEQKEEDAFWARAKERKNKVIYDFEKELVEDDGKTIYRGLVDKLLDDSKATDAQMFNSKETFHEYKAQFLLENETDSMASAKSFTLAKINGILYVGAGNAEERETRPKLPLYRAVMRDIDTGDVTLQKVEVNANLQERLYDLANNFGEEVKIAMLRSKKTDLELARDEIVQDIYEGELPDIDLVDPSDPNYAVKHLDWEVKTAFREEAKKRKKKSN